MLIVAGNGPSFKLFKPTKEGLKTSWSPHGDVPLNQNLISGGIGTTGVSWDSGNARVALCGSQWSDMLLHDFGNDDVHSIPIPHGLSQNTCCFNKTGEVLGSAGVSGLVHTWEEASKGGWKVQSKYSVSANTVNNLSFNRTSELLVSSDTKGTLGIHNTSSNQSSVITSTAGEASALQCSIHEGSEVVVGHCQGTLNVLNMETGQYTARYPEHHLSTVTDIAYSVNNGLLLATAGLDKKVRLLALQHNKVVKTYECDDPVYSVEFVKASLVISTETEVMIYDLNTNWSERRRFALPWRGTLARYQTSRTPLNPKDRSMSTPKSNSEREHSEREHSEDNAAAASPSKSSVPKETVSSEAGDITAQSCDLSIMNSDVTDLSFNMSPVVRAPVQEVNIAPTREVVPRSIAVPGGARRGRSSLGGIPRPSRADSPPLARLSLDNLRRESLDLRRQSIERNIIASVQKRSASGDIKQNKEQQPKSCPDKMWTLDEEGKENAAPSSLLDTPGPSLPSASSTPLPTAEESAELFTESPCTLPSKMRKVEEESLSHTHVDEKSHTQSHTQSHTIGERSSVLFTESPCSSRVKQQSTSKMSADSLSVNDLSKALKKLGKRASPLDIATIQAEAHQIKQAEAHQIRQAEAQKVRQAERLSEGGEGDGLIDELVNDYSQAEAEPQNAAPQVGVVLNSVQMALIQGFITQSRKELEQTVLSESRWVKTTLLNNIIYTENNLKDEHEKTQKELQSAKEMISSLESRVIDLENQLGGGPSILGFNMNTRRGRS